MVSKVIITHSNLAEHEANAEIIYLSAPIRTYHESEYERAVGIIRKRHPDGVLLLSRDLFTDSLDFRLAYRDKLAAIAALYILPDRKLRVGAGVYAEWEYLKYVSLGCKEMFAFNPNEGFGIHPDFVLQPLPLMVRTMREFARVIYHRRGR